MASTYDYEVGINEIEGDSEEEEEDEIEATEPPHHARRPMNAFLIFCKRQRAVVKERFPQLENRAVTKILGEWWANLEESEKSCYTDLAKQYREAFLKANPGFKWYKLPAPPLRPISNRLKLLTGLSSHQGSITPGKLADESQLGGLSSLLVPYNNMSVSPSLAIQSIPKPPKKRYLEENATTDDDPNQVFDDMPEKAVTLESEMFLEGGESNAILDKIVEVEPFAKLRNYSVTAKENSARVKSESDSDSDIMSNKNSNGSLQPISSAENHFVASSNNNISNNDSKSCNLNRNGFEIKSEEKFSTSEGSRMYINVDTLSNNTFLRNGLDCTEVKWRTKFEKIKSRHSNYNNNNNDETLDFLKCPNYECSSNQDSSLNKQTNEKSKDNGPGGMVKVEEIFSNGDGKLTLHAAEEMDDHTFDSHGSLLQVAPSSSAEYNHSLDAFNKSSVLNKKSDIVFYGSNKLPDLKTANKLLSKSVPISSNETDSNFMRRNKSVRACKGVRYQEFMSSNQLGRKRRRKMNASNDSRYYGNEDEDTLNRHLVKIGSEEDKLVKDEDKYERMEVESAIYSIHDDLDQNDITFSESSSFNVSPIKSSQPRKTKHIRSTKRRRSSQKGTNSFEFTNDELDFDRKNNSTNFNLEEKIEALPALSLEEFQEKKRARNKKHYYLENNIGHEFPSDSQFSCTERHSNFQTIKNSSLVLKSQRSESSSPSIGFDEKGPMHKNFASKPSYSKDTNGHAMYPNGSIADSEVDRKLGLLVAVSVSNGSPAQSYSSSASSVNGSNQKSPSSAGSSDVVVGSRKRKARKQKITHLEPGSKQKDTSVVEVDVLNDMGLATLAEVAARSKKESII